jgi:hypothetical protein
LPERSEDFAEALTGRLRALVPQWPDIPSAPEFKPFIAKLQEGAAEIHSWRAGGAVHCGRNHDEVESISKAWQGREENLILGRRALVLAESDWLHCTYQGESISGDFSPQPGQEDSFEGYAVQPSISPFSGNLYGEITLVNGISRSGTELQGRFHWLTLRPLLAFEGANPERPQPDDFKPLVAFTAPSDAELPEFGEEHLEYWRS